LKALIPGDLWEHVVTPVLPEALYDPAALRRRYRRGCEAAGLRPVRLHGLRHAAKLESTFTYEGTDQIHTLAIGRALTGSSAF